MTKEQKVYWRKYKDDHGITWKKLTQVINEETGSNYTNVRDMLKRVRIEQRPTLVFGDTHFPYHREGYLEFLLSVKKRFNCNDRPIHMGDLVDNHAISFHEKEPDLHGHAEEEALAKIQIKRLVKAFPNLTITLGNHDLLVTRKAKSVGISERYLKSFHKVWDLPKSVTVTDEIIIDNVLYNHGIGSSGKDGAINTAVAQQMSYVQGHAHSNGGCKYVASPRNLIYGLNAGCLFDPKSLAAAYGKHFVKRPTLGCGVVFSDKFAIFVPWVLE